MSGHHVSNLSMAELIVAIKVKLCLVKIVARYVVDAEDLKQCSVWAQYSYALAMGLTRCSICILLIRIFSTRPFKRIGG